MHGVFCHDRDWLAGNTDAQHLAWPKVKRRRGRADKSWQGAFYSSVGECPDGIAVSGCARMVGVANHIAKVGGLCFVAGLGLTLGGCGGSSPDPVQLGRFRPTPAVNVILDSLGVADEPAVAWENG